MTRIQGTLIAPEGITAANPAFDVTPHRYITAIITDKGIIKKPYTRGLKRFPEVIIDVTSSKTLVFVGAHPDDESFGVGGTLAQYAAAGLKVYYICGTRGEVGEVAAGNA